MRHLWQSKVVCITVVLWCGAFAEISCARLLQRSSLSERDRLIEHINRARHLVDRALGRKPQSSPTAMAFSTKLMTIERSELLQLRSELAATQAVAASDLNTTVNVQTLNARVNRVKRMVSDLFEPEHTQNADGASTDGNGGSRTVDGASDTIPINRSLLENLNVQVNAIDRLVGT